PERLPQNRPSTPSRWIPPFHDFLGRLPVWLLLGVGGLVTNQPPRRSHVTGGYTGVVDGYLWGELVAAAGENSCPSAGRNLSAAGEFLMSADTMRS
ncbi:MAG: hypothetical protein ACP5OV_08355, partial [Acidimicrobiales bacterium]